MAGRVKRDLLNTFARCFCVRAFCAIYMKAFLSPGLSQFKQECRRPIHFSRIQGSNALEDAVNRDGELRPARWYRRSMHESAQLWKIFSQPLVLSVRYVIVLYVWNSSEGHVGEQQGQI